MRDIGAELKSLRLYGMAGAWGDLEAQRGVAGQPFDRDPGPRCEGGTAGLAGVDRSVVEDEDHRPAGMAKAGGVTLIEAFEQGDEVAAALAGRSVNDQFARCRVAGAQHGHFAGSPRCLNAQVGTAQRPGMGEIRMGQGFRFIGEQQHDVAGLGLRFTQLKAQADPLDRLRLLAALQRVAGAAPAEPPFFRSRMLSRDF